MLDCLTTRQRLDSLPIRERHEESEVAQHLHGCSECQNYLARLNSFDQQMSIAIKDVPIPAELQQDLLTLISAELSEAAPEPVITRHPTSRSWLWIPRLSGGLVAAVLVVMIWSSWPQSDVSTPLEYTVVKQKLVEELSRIEESSWQELPEFDQHSFNIEEHDSALRNWSLSSARGFDLGNDSDHDAALYQFSFKKWSGTLIALPTSELSGAPEDFVAVPASGHPILEWRSTDGKLTYLCLVEHGSAEELAGVMFGNIG